MWGDMAMGMAVFNCSASPLKTCYHHHHHDISHGLIGWTSVVTRKTGLMIQHTRPNLSCFVSMTNGESDNQGKLKLDQIIDNAREIWNGFPQPVKVFSWNSVLENFIQLLLDIAIFVVKYLSAPLLAVSSLSEMSYCAHERKLFLVPIPLIIGFAIAGILKETAQEVSPLIKDSEVPWHLIAIAVLLTFLKLPGPYYPYWGRIFIPHFANGGLLRIFVMMWFWYRRPKKNQMLQNLESSE